MAELFTVMTPDDWDRKERGEEIKGDVLYMVRGGGKTYWTKIKTVAEWLTKERGKGIMDRQGMDRFNAILDGKADDLTIDEVQRFATALDVHPFTLLWPEKVKDDDLLIVDEFFKNLTFEKMRTAVHI